MSEDEHTTFIYNRCSCGKRHALKLFDNGYVAQCPHCKGYHESPYIRDWGSGPQFDKHGDMTRGPAYERWAPTWPPCAVSTQTS